MSYLTNKTDERRGGIVEVQKVPLHYVRMDDNFVVVIDSFVDSDNSN